MAVSKRLRFEVLRRDGHTCIYCGASAPTVALTVDHVVPVTLGGNDEPENLVTSCQPCNAGKSSITPDAPVVASVAADALRWRDAMLTCATGDAVLREERDLHRKYFEKTWKIWTYEGRDGERHTIDLPIDWPITIDNLVAAGIDDSALWDAVDIAMRTKGVKDEFAYFAGICWRQIYKRQEIARLMLDAEDERSANGPD